MSGTILVLPPFPRKVVKEMLDTEALLTSDEFPRNLDESLLCCAMANLFPRGFGPDRIHLLPLTTVDAPEMQAIDVIV
jgi:hypothetical protein